MCKQITAFKGNALNCTIGSLHYCHKMQVPDIGFVWCYVVLVCLFRVFLNGYVLSGRFRYTCWIVANTTCGNCRTRTLVRGQTSVIFTWHEGPHALYSVQLCIVINQSKEHTNNRVISKYFGICKHTRSK